MNRLLAFTIVLAGAATLGRTLCMVLNGTQGDVNHVNVKPLSGERNGLKRDFDDVDRGYESATSAFGPSVADDLIAGQLELLGRLYR